MPEESHAADEHALMAEIKEPLSSLPAEPPSISPPPEFPVVRRGYDRFAVDAYVRRTSSLLSELQARHSPDVAVRRALERVGEEVSGILQRAHETAGQLTVDSRREAEERLQTAQREAEELEGRTRRAADELREVSTREAKDRVAGATREAEQIIARARREAEQIIADARDRLIELDADADRVWAERERIVDDVRGLAQELSGLAEAAAERFPPAGTGEETVLPAGGEGTAEIQPAPPSDPGVFPDPDETAPFRMPSDPGTTFRPSEPEAGA